VADALARNDRYLHEFVERWNLCPFARRCRETGKLDRRVLLAAERGAALAAAEAAVRAIEARPRDAVEVALLIFPALRVAPRDFEELCADLRGRTSGVDFHCVAFHPDHPEDLSDPNRAVAFIRRSPDPTIQLVRASLLEEVRAGRPGGSVFVDPSRVTREELMALAGLSVSERIARANFDTLGRPETAAEARALLLEIKRR